MLTSNASKVRDGSRLARIDAPADAACNTGSWSNRVAMVKGGGGQLVLHCWLERGDVTWVRNLLVVLSSRHVVRAKHVPRDQPRSSTRLRSSVVRDELILVAL